MNLKILGSGSSGNCYLLENETECLVIEAGLPFKEVKKSLNFNVMKIVGVVVSHIHGDHAKYLQEYEKAGIQVFKPYRYQYCGNVFLPRQYGNFSIATFPLVHDVPCHGFYITHPDIGSLVYASDTEYVKYRFKGLNHVMIEANYDMQFVDKSNPNYEHVLTGHMSLDTTLNFIHTNDNPNLKTICLIHLSEKNADSGEFIQRTKEITKKDVYVARKGLVIDLSGTPNWAK